VIYVLLALCLALEFWVWQQHRQLAAHTRRLDTHSDLLASNRQTLDAHQRHLGLHQRCIEAHRDLHDRMPDTGGLS